MEALTTSQLSSFSRENSLEEIFTQPVTVVMPKVSPCRNSSFSPNRRTPGSNHSPASANGSLHSPSAFSPRQRSNSFTPPHRSPQTVTPPHPYIALPHLHHSPVSSLRCPTANAHKSGGSPSSAISGVMIPEAKKPASRNQFLSSTHHQHHPSLSNQHVSHSASRKTQCHLGAGLEPNVDQSLATNSQDQISVRDDPLPLKALSALPSESLFGSSRFTSTPMQQFLMQISEAYGLHQAVSMPDHQQVCYILLQHVMKLPQQQQVEALDAIERLPDLISRSQLTAQDNVYVERLHQLFNEVEQSLQCLQSRSSLLSYQGPHSLQGHQLHQDLHSNEGHQTLQGHHSLHGHKLYQSNEDHQSLQGLQALLDRQSHQGHKSLPTVHTQIVQASGHFTPTHISQSFPSSHGSKTPAGIVRPSAVFPSHLGQTRALFNESHNGTLNLGNHSVLDGTTTPHVPAKSFSKKRSSSMTGLPQKRQKKSEKTNTKDMHLLSETSTGETSESPVQSSKTPFDIDRTTSFDEFSKNNFPKLPSDNSSQTSQLQLMSNCKHTKTSTYQLQHVSGDNKEDQTKSYQSTGTSVGSTWLPVLNIPSILPTSSSVESSSTDVLPKKPCQEKAMQETSLFKPSSPVIGNILNEGDLKIAMHQMYLKDFAARLAVARARPFNPMIRQNVSGSRENKETTVNQPEVPKIPAETKWRDERGTTELLGSLPKCSMNALFSCSSSVDSKSPCFPTSQDVSTLSSNFLTTRTCDTGKVLEPWLSSLHGDSRGDKSSLITRMHETDNEIQDSQLSASQGNSSVNKYSSATSAFKISTHKVSNPFVSDSRKDNTFSTCSLTQRTSKSNSTAWHSQLTILQASSTVDQYSSTSMTCQNDDQVPNRGFSASEQNNLLDTCSLTVSTSQATDSLPDTNLTSAVSDLSCDRLVTSATTSCLNDDTMHTSTDSNKWTYPTIVTPELNLDDNEDVFYSAPSPEFLPTETVKEGSQMSLKDASVDKSSAPVTQNFNSRETETFAVNDLPSSCDRSFSLPSVSDVLGASNMLESLKDEDFIDSFEDERNSNNVDKKSGVCETKSNHYLAEKVPSRAVLDGHLCGSSAEVQSSSDMYDICAGDATDHSSGRNLLQDNHVPELSKDAEKRKISSGANTTSSSVPQHCDLYQKTSNASKKDIKKGVEHVRQDDNPDRAPSFGEDLLKPNLLQKQKSFPVSTSPGYPENICHKEVQNSKQKEMHPSVMTSVIVSSNISEQLTETLDVLSSRGLAYYLSNIKSKENMNLPYAPGSIKGKNTDVSVPPEAGSPDALRHHDDSQTVPSNTNAAANSCVNALLSSQVSVPLDRLSSTSEDRQISNRRYSLTEEQALQNNSRRNSFSPHEHPQPFSSEKSPEYLDLNFKGQVKPFQQGLESQPWNFGNSKIKDSRNRTLSEPSRKHIIPGQEKEGKKAKTESVSSRKRRSGPRPCKHKRKPCKCEKAKVQVMNIHEKPQNVSVIQLQSTERKTMGISQALNSSYAKDEGASVVSVVKHKSSTPPSAIISDLKILPTTVCSIPGNLRAVVRLKNASVVWPVPTGQKIHHFKKDIGSTMTAGTTNQFKELRDSAKVSLERVLDTEKSENAVGHPSHLTVGNSSQANKETSISLDRGSDTPEMTEASSGSPESLTGDSDAYKAQMHHVQDNNLAQVVDNRVTVLSATRNIHCGSSNSKEKLVERSYSSEAPHSESSHEYTMIQQDSGGNNLHEVEKDIHCQDMERRECDEIVCATENTNQQQKTAVLNKDCLSEATLSHSNFLNIASKLCAGTQRMPLIFDLSRRPALSKDNSSNKEPQGFSPLKSQADEKKHQFKLVRKSNRQRSCRHKRKPCKCDKSISTSNSCNSPAADLQKVPSTKPLYSLPKGQVIALERLSKDVTGLMQNVIDQTTENEKQALTSLSAKSSFSPHSQPVCIRNFTDDADSIQNQGTQLRDLKLENSGTSVKFLTETEGSIKSSFPVSPDNIYRFPISREARQLNIKEIQTPALTKASPSLDYLNDEAIINKKPVIKPPLEELVSKQSLNVGHFNAEKPYLERTDSEDHNKHLDVTGECDKSTAEPLVPHTILKDSDAALRPTIEQRAALLNAGPEELISEDKGAHRLDSDFAVDADKLSNKSHVEKEVSLTIHDRDSIKDGNDVVSIRPAAFHPASNSLVQFSTHPASVCDKVKKQIQETSVRHLFSKNPVVNQAQETTTQYIRDQGSELIHQPGGEILSMEGLSISQSQETYDEHLPSEQAIEQSKKYSEHQPSKSQTGVQIKKTYIEHMLSEGSIMEKAISCDQLSSKNQAAEQTLETYTEHACLKNQSVGQILEASSEPSTPLDETIKQTSETHAEHSNRQCQAVEEVQDLSGELLSSKVQVTEQDPETCKFLTSNNQTSRQTDETDRKDASDIEQIASGNESNWQTEGTDAGEDVIPEYHYDNDYSIQPLSYDLLRRAIDDQIIKEEKCAKIAPRTGKRQVIKGRRRSCILHANSYCLRCIGFKYLQGDWPDQSQRFEVQISWETFKEQSPPNRCEEHNRLFCVRCLLEERREKLKLQTGKIEPEKPDAQSPRQLSSVEANSGKDSEKRKGSVAREDPPTSRQRRNTRSAEPMEEITKEVSLYF